MSTERVAPSFPCCSYENDTDPPTPRGLTDLSRLRPPGQSHTDEAGMPLGAEESWSLRHSWSLGTARGPESLTDFCSVKPPGIQDFSKANCSFSIV